MFYIDWNTNFPSTDCNLIDSYGGVPQIVWEPWLSSSNTLDAISGGAYDTYINNFAQAAKAWNKLIYLRFGHEMNGNWYPWDGTHNGGSAGPAKYIAAWRHIRAIFTNAGATNVKFVWSANHINCPTDAWNDAVNYYPGAAYVDWIGLDGYNWGTGNWQSFSQIFSSYYTTFSSYGKPIMISEFACTTDEAGSTKAVWLTDAFTNIRNNYPQIRMFNWFNVNKERDWRIDSSAGSQTAFQNALNNAYFLDSKPDF
jgi:beta-mannanase